MPPEARRLLPRPTEGPSTHDRPVHGPAARWALLGLFALSAVSCGAGSPTDVQLQSATVTRADQRLIRIDVAACNSQPYEVHATESAVAVRVRITTSQPQGQAAAPSCSDGISLRLAQPIGSRVLIDLTTGHQVPLGPLPTASP